MNGTHRAAVLAVLLALLIPVTLGAQFQLDESPNLRRGWGLDRAQLGFLLEHRFEFLGGSGGLVNLPTLVVAGGLPGGVTAGLAYTSQSEIVPGGLGGGETELWLRRSFRISPALQVTPQAGHNGAARSWDTGLLLQWKVGPATLLAEGRGYTRLFGAEAAAGAAVGAALSLTDHLAVMGDVGRVLQTDSPDPAWSAGLTLRIPGSPHTLGVHASNVGATTLQGVSRPAVIGIGRTRFGFVFTTPLSAARWRELGRRGQIAEVAGRDTAAHAVEMRDFAYHPAEIRIEAGQAVTWVNRDAFEHTVTGEGWGSGLLSEGERFTHRFEEPGRYPYTCAPHPFMRGTVIVDPPSAAPPADAAMEHEPSH